MVVDVVVVLAVIVTILLLLLLLVVVVVVVIHCHEISEPHFVCKNVTGSMDPQMMGVSSRSCINRSEAQVGELLLYSDNKRACSVFPQVCCYTQTINMPVQCFLRYVTVFRQ